LKLRLRFRWIKKVTIEVEAKIERYLKVSSALTFFGTRMRS